MIRIKYCGRMGNSLLQYAFARILSEQLEQYLPPHPISGFSNTYKDVNKDAGGKRGEYLVVTKKNLWDIGQLRKLMVDSNKTNILLRSSCANYNNFKEHKDAIRKDWFCVEQPYDKNKLCLSGKFFIWDKLFKSINVDKIERDDIIVNVRLGEILNPPYRSRLLLFDYFDIILRNVKFNRLFITSDSMESQELRPFDKYSPIYFFQSNYMETLNLIRLFNRIIISQSSYSWWCAYLSEASEIYYPIVQRGPWLVNPRNDEDLRVNEDRYIYVSQKHSKIMGSFDNVSEW